MLDSGATYEKATFNCEEFTVALLYPLALKMIDTTEI